MVRRVNLFNSKPAKLLMCKFLLGKLCLRKHWGQELRNKGGGGEVARKEKRGREAAGINNIIIPKVVQWQEPAEIEIIFCNRKSRKRRQPLSIRGGNQE